MYGNPWYSLLLPFAGDTLYLPTLQPSHPGPVLKISAFNIQIFGQSKFKKEDVVATLVQVSNHWHNQYVAVQMWMKNFIVKVTEQ